MPDLATIAFITLLAIGWSIFRKGWRGRAVDNHPWCRKCKFDLHTVWPNTTKCPECGTDLTPVGTVELGRRVKRPILTTLGALMLLASALWFTQSARQAIGPINWADHKPNWLLVRETQSANPATAKRALDRIIAQSEKKPLTDSQLKSLAIFALGIQADPNAQWLTGWGDVIVAAWQKNLLNPDQILQFAQNAVTITMQPEFPAVRQWDIARAGPCVTINRTTTGSMTLFLTPLTASISGTELAVNADEAAQFSLHQSFGPLLAKSFPVLATPGERELAITWRARLSLDKSVSTPATWDVPLSAPLSVMERSPDAIEPVVDDETTARVRNSVEIQAIGLRVPPQTGTGAMRASVFIGVTIHDSPVGLSLHVESGQSLRHALGWRRLEWRVPTGESRIMRVTLPAPANETDPCTVVLSPNYQQQLPNAFMMGYNKQVWFGKPIEFTDIPVQWFDTEDDPDIPESLRPLLQNRFGSP